MPGEAQDIYQSRGPRREVIEARPPTGAPPDLRTWRDRIATLIFIASLVLLFGVLVAIIAIQYRTIHQTLAPEAEVIPIEVRTARMTSTLEMDPEGRYVADELDDVVPREIPATGDIPMTMEWIKQAARHLQQGDLGTQRGSWSIAIANYRNAQRILPGITNVSARIGLCHLRLKEYADAERIFASLLETDPENLPLRNNLGVALMGQGKTDDAQASFTRVMAADAKYAPAIRNLALLHYRAKRMEPAAALFAEARTLQPDDVDLAHMLAVSYLRLERWTDAARVLGDSAQRAPDAAPIFFRLAEALSHTDDADGCVKALTRAVELVDARTALRWLTRKEFDAMRDRPEFRSIVEQLTNATR
jgi:Flp pilus assembly protein TadD